MHVADCQQDFSDIKHGHIIAKAAILTQAIEQLPTRAELEQHVDEGLVLERSLQRVNKWVVEFAEDLFLKLDVLYLFEVHYVRFRYLLEC